MIISTVWFRRWSGHIDKVSQDKISYNLEKTICANNKYFGYLKPKGSYHGNQNE